MSWKKERDKLVKYLDEVTMTNKPTGRVDSPDEKYLRNISCQKCGCGGGISNQPYIWRCPQCHKAIEVTALLDSPEMVEAVTEIMLAEMPVIRDVATHIDPATMERSFTVYNMPPLQAREYVVNMAKAALTAIIERLK